MGQNHEYILNTETVGKHYALTTRTVRDMITADMLKAVRVNGVWRCCWHDVWAAEQGPMPRGERAEAYKMQLLSKKGVAAEWGVCVRTVERWMEHGLPTRNVSGSVRVAPIDAKEWSRRTFGFEKAA